MSEAVAAGMLLVATRRDGPESTFYEAVVLVVDVEPSGIRTGLCLNRPLATSVTDESPLALLFIADPSARAFWGGPMGRDLPAILAEFASVDGLEWFHLPHEQRRPFPLPEIGVIAVAEHTAPFEDRIRRARLYVGLCVWGRGQLEAEIGRGDWLVRRATAETIFSEQPAQLWSELSA